MKETIWKWIKQYRVAAGIFSIGMLILIVSGSFAAYTSFNSVKRVVSTERRSDTMFGSNYLTLLNLTDNNYSIRRITLSEEGDKNTFTVKVCNYAWGDKSLYNTKDIMYTVQANLIAMDGGKLPENITNIRINAIPFNANGKCELTSQELKAGKAREDTYRFELPAELKNKIEIQIVAEPTSESVEAVNSQKLAAVISFADYESVKSWTGHFLDSQANGRTPANYDAFNYEISGNGAGTVTMTWPESLQLSKWTTDGKQVTGSYSFDVDGATTAVQFQFYRNPENKIDAKTWAELEKLVTVTFEEKVEENGIKKK
mgnify:CR=1 FL=1